MMKVGALFRSMQPFLHIECCFCITKAIFVSIRRRHYFYLKLLRSPVLLPTSYFPWIPRGPSHFIYLQKLKAMAPRNAKRFRNDNNSNGAMSVVGLVQLNTDKTGATMKNSPSVMYLIHTVLKNCTGGFRPHLIDRGHTPLVFSRRVSTRFDFHWHCRQGWRFWLLNCEGSNAMTRLEGFVSLKKVIEQIEEKMGAIHQSINMYITSCLFGKWGTVWLLRRGEGKTCSFWLQSIYIILESKYMHSNQQRD